MKAQCYDKTQCTNNDVQPTYKKSKTGLIPRSQSLATLKVKVSSSAALVNSSVLIQTIE